MVILYNTLYMRKVESNKATKACIMECLETKSRIFGVVCLENTEKNTIPYQEELMVALTRIVANHMISKRWTVLSVSVQLSL